MKFSLSKLLAACSIGLFVTLAVLSFALVQAQISIPKPAVPSFAVELIDRSYDVAASTTIDPYTGQTMNRPAHRVENYTVDLTITNQPYTSIVLQEGTAQWNTSLVYNVRVKGHFGQDWVNMYYSGEGLKPSNQDFTTISYQLLPETPFQTLFAQQ